LSVFVVGTCSFAETVEAAKWKKFDSGKFKADDGSVVTFTSYIKGSNKIHMKMYVKSKLVATMDLKKTGQKVVMTIKNNKGKVLAKETKYTKKSLKNYYYSN